MFREANGRVTFVVRVVPRASKNEIIGTEAEMVKVRLTAPPVEGKANDALVTFLASMLDVPRSSVEILAGESSRNKTISIRGVSAERAAKVLLHGT